MTSVQETVTEPLEAEITKMLIEGIVEMGDDMTASMNAEMGPLFDALDMGRMVITIAAPPVTVTFVEKT